MMMNWFVLTSAQNMQALGYNTGPVWIEPRVVDNLSPGIGINLNDAATDYDPAEPVFLTGMYVAPKRIVDDPNYIANAPAMVAFLLTLPFCSLESETIFAPVVDE